MACKFYFNGEEFASEDEAKARVRQYLIDEGGLDEFVKNETIDLSQIKPAEYAVQKPSAGEILQPTPSGIRKEGGERGGVEPSEQGEAVAKKSKQAKGYEEKAIGTEKSRKLAILNRLMQSENIPQEYKDGLTKKGLTYQVSNQFQANEAALGIINDLGITEALQLARTSTIDPSVGSAVFSQSLNKLWTDERAAKASGDISLSEQLAQDWADISMEYAELSNQKGKWNSQIAYFYKTSPIGLVKRIENERVSNFEDWFKNKEEGYQEAFDEIIKGEAGQALLKIEVEKLRKQERAQERSAKKQKVYKIIDDTSKKWIEKLSSAAAKGAEKQGLGVEEIINTAANAMKKAYDAGESIATILEDAVKYISEKLGTDNWAKDEFRKDWEAKLAISEKKEDSYIKVLQRRATELERRLAEKDFSAEEYKGKVELSEREKEVKAQYLKVKEQYDELKKQSPEFIDKKAKQYLDRLRQRLSGLTMAQKEEIITRSIKKITESGGLEFQDFREIVAESIGVKKLTDAEIQRIETLTEQSNIPDELEQAFLNNPTRKSLDDFKNAKAKSLEADRELFQLTHNRADIIGTLKSIMTLNLLSAGTIIKNFSQNVLYQLLVRFPVSATIITADKSIYYSSVLANKLFGTKIIKSDVNFTDAQKGYFKEYNEGRIRGWEQMIKGIDERDYFAKNQYASNLNPRKSLNDLKAFTKGDLFLTKSQRVDKFIQSTLGWQPYAVSRLMIYGDKPPRYAAQGAAAMQIGHQELNITDPLAQEAFMLAPEKYSYNLLIKEGKTAEEASKISKSIADRIIDAGAKATFQNENYFNDFFKNMDQFMTVKKDEKIGGRIIKPPLALLKTSQLPFIKTPANIMWAYIKIANPVLTSGKSLVELGMAQNALKKGNYIKYKEYLKSSKESFGMAVIGYGISAAAVALAEKGLIRTKNEKDKDKPRETIGEQFFGKDNQVNLGKLLGKEDFWVDLSWFSAIGTILDTQARIIEDKKAAAAKGEVIEDSFGDDILSTFNNSISASLNTLVLDQGANFIDGIRKGFDGMQDLTVNTFNTFTNMFTGATLAAFSKAMLPEKAVLQGDTMVDRIINNQKQRNMFISWAAGYPPSKISMWGETMPTDRSITGVMGAMLGFEKGSENKFGAILFDDQQRTGDNRFFPPVEKKTIKINGKDVDLSLEEKRWLDIYIGEARKSFAAPFIYEMSTYPKFVEKDGQKIQVEKKYSELNDEDKIEALSKIYKLGKDAGFEKFKAKYTQYQDAEINVEEIIKKAFQSAESKIFESRLMTKPE